MTESGGYTFSEDNSDKLKRFFEAVAANPSPDNKWRAHFSGQNRATPGKQSPIVVIGESSDSFSGDQAIDVFARNSEEERDFMEYIETACRENNLSQSLEEIASTCLKNSNLLENMANLSDNAVSNLTTSLCKNNAKTDVLKHFLLKFLLCIVKHKEHSRLIDNMIYETFQNIPKQFNATFLPALLNEPDASVDIFSNFVKSLNAADKLTVFNELLAVTFTGNQFLLHTPSILALYKSFSDSFVASSIVKLLCTHSEVGSNDKNYGKLLLAVTQSSEAASGHFEVLNGLCLIHQTVFKKACLNALNKLNK